MQKISKKCCCTDYSKKPIILSLSSNMFERILVGVRDRRLVCKKCSRPITDYEIKELLKHSNDWFGI